MQDNASMLLSSLSQSKIISLIESNNRHQYIQLFSDCSNVRLIDNKGCLRIESSIGDPYFNRVFYSSFLKDDLVHRTNEIIQRYRQLNVPSIWFVGPWNDGDQLEKVLIDAGYLLSREETGMAIDLDKNANKLVFDSPVSIRQCRNIRDLKDWLESIAPSFDYKSEISQHLFKSFRDKKLYLNPKWKFYTGYLEDKPVTASRLFIHQGAAGIHHVGTNPEYRGKGFGTALTIFPLLEAMKSGYRIGVLRASSMGKNIYQKIGFKEFSTYRFYRSS